MSCILPPSSCILHLTVPTLVCVVCPLNPFIFMSDDLGGLMKSCRLLVIDWLQQFSTKMSYESVSKCMIGLDFFLVDLASIVLSRKGVSMCNWWVFCVSRFVPEKLRRFAFEVGHLFFGSLSVEYAAEKV